MKHYMVGNFVVLAQRYVDKVFIMSIVVYDQKERERRRRQYLIVVIFVSLFLFFFFLSLNSPAIFFIYIYFFSHVAFSGTKHEFRGYAVRFYCADTLFYIRVRGVFPSFSPVAGKNDRTTLASFDEANFSLFLFRLGEVAQVLNIVSSFCPRRSWRRRKRIVI